MAIDKEQQKVRPTGALGIERWVQFAFLACAMVAAWFLYMSGNALWMILSDNIDVVPEANDTLVLAAAGLIAVVAAIVSYRSTKIHGFVTEVSVELSKVSWPSRQETWAQTIVVLIVSAVAAVILGVFDSAWSWITDMIYNV